MSNEPNRPAEAQELTEKELEGVVGGLRRSQISGGLKGKCAAVAVSQMEADASMAVFLDFSEGKANMDSH